MPNTSRTTSKSLAWLSLLLAAIMVVMLLMGYRAEVGPFAVGALATLALFCMRHPVLKSYAFTVWVFAFVAASMFYPQAFMTWAGWDLGKLIVPLIQIIMFGMGTTLSVADFTRVLKMPWPVFIGFALQFLIMPLVGFTLAKTFGFPDEIAAGVVLIGCCPSGVASNVMAYLARGDVALSVTITSFTTLASPFLTPFLMDKLAGQFIEVNPLKMMFEIINMIIVPIAAGLIANRILFSRRPVFQRRRGPGSDRRRRAPARRRDPAPGPGGRSSSTAMPSLQRTGFVVGLLLIATVTVVKLVVSVWLKRPGNWIDKALPLVSMAAICCIIAVITARSRNDLLTVGPWLIGSSMIHNCSGLSDGVLARAGDSFEGERLPDRGVRGRHAERRHGLGPGDERAPRARRRPWRRPSSVPGRTSPARSWPRTGIASRSRKLVRSKRLAASRRKEN